MAGVGLMAFVELILALFVLVLYTWGTFSFETAVVLLLFFTAVGANDRATYPRSSHWERDNDD